MFSKKYTLNTMQKEVQLQNTAKFEIHNLK